MPAVSTETSSGLHGEIHGNETPTFFFGVYAPVVQCVGVTSVFPFRSRGNTGCICYHATGQQNRCGGCKQMQKCRQAIQRIRLTWFTFHPKYNSAFKSQRLQNWCETKHFKEKPTAHHGHTTFIANDRGHLFPGAVKRGSAWPDFKGTWDLPARIPPCHINPTSRSVEGLNRLKSWGFDPQYTGKSPPHTGSKNTDRRQDVAKQSDGVVQQEGAAPFSAGEAQPLPQSCAATTALIPHIHPHLSVLHFLRGFYHIMSCPSVMSSCCERADQ
uniref:protein Flattop isoform X2 n=1 Tax=Monopterus albus TaxID=43700 RepID=UPI0009B4050A|nr:protein Flattop isoform X2 [Monopterus albus]